MQYSLLMGRYQPLHDGHKTLIRKILDEGKNVCVALKKTAIDDKNPYTYRQRKGMFKKAFKEEIKSGRIKIIKVPDVTEVCWGRKVGWSTREIRLDPETEKISATKIRKKNESNFRKNK